MFDRVLLAPVLSFSLNIDWDDGSFLLQDAASGLNDSSKMLGKKSLKMQIKDGNSMDEINWQGNCNFAARKFKIYFHSKGTDYLS